VNRSGDTITGGLTVNGELVAAATYLRFTSSGSGGYIMWNGGASYSLGSAGTIWHTGNLNPIQSGRWTGGGQLGQLTSGWSGVPSGGVITELYKDPSAYNPVTYIQYKYLQLLTPGGWFTVAVG
jgi:hypothetical protein